MDAKVTTKERLGQAQASLLRIVADNMGRPAETEEEAQEALGHLAHDTLAWWEDIGAYLQQLPIEGQGGLFPDLKPDVPKPLNQLRDKHG